MRGNWTNLILHTSALIYKRKNNVASSAGSKSILDVFAIIFLELFLALISFPLYLVSKGESTKGKAQYKIRRIFTLSFLIVILVVWLLKLVLIVALPIYFENRQFVITTQNNRQGQATEQNYVMPEVYNTRLDTSIPPPTVENISKTNNGSLFVSGKASASSKIIINIGKNQEAAAEDDNNIKIYIVNTDTAGNWKLETDVNSFSLQPGKYWLQAMAYDDIDGTKSDSSLAKYFEINQNIYDRVISKADMYLNYFMIAFIILGIFSIIMLI